MKKIILFIRNSFSEISPLENLKVLHTNFRADILSGITVAIIALPLALAFGEISQLGPIAGVWGAIAGGIIGGLFGGCLVGVSGPTAPKAAQIAAFMGAFVIGTTNDPDLIAAFSIIFLSGLILIFISLLKISRFIHYIPYPVVSGFMCGIGVIVILTQINAFFGLETEKSIQAVFQNFQSTIANINIDALYVSVPSLFILFSWNRLGKYMHYLANIPAPLVALIFGTGIAYFMNLDIPYIGDKMGEANKSEIFTFYIPDLSRLAEFFLPALALAVLAILDSLLSCKVADNMIGKKHSSDRETFGQGMANMVAGLIGGVTTATATMRTVANIQFGGKTPLASIVHGLTLLAILLGLGFLVAAIPNACLAAILFKVGIDILDYRILPVLRKIPLMDLLVFITVLCVTVYKDLMVAVAVGSLFIFIRYFKELRFNYKHKNIPLDKSDYCPENLDQKSINELSANVLVPAGPLFFGSVESLIDVYSKAPHHKALIIDMHKVSIVDLTGIYALEDFINEVKSKNIKVVISNMNFDIQKTIKKIFSNFEDQFNYKDSRESVFTAIDKL